MEALDDVIEKRMSDSLVKFMKLVDPDRTYPITHELGCAWNRLTLKDQRKLYLFFLYRKWRKIDIYGDPYQIITCCHPYPFDWNGHSIGASLIAERKAIIANYKGRHGTYTRDEAKLYDMTDKQWFQCQIQK